MYLSCFLMPTLFSAQIAGVTATKVNSFNARTLDKNTVEFEPNYGITSASRFWDDNGTSQPIFQSADSIAFSSVSYTHLRAHETSLHLVCRLLLEKKNE